MWFNIPTEKETDKEAHRGEKSLMPNPSPEVSLHGFTMEILDIFKDCRHLKREKGGFKCGSTYRQRKKLTKKPTEERKVSCQIEV